MWKYGHAEQLIATFVCQISMPAVAQVLDVRLMVLFFLEAIETLQLWCPFEQSVRVGTYLYLQIPREEIEGTRRLVFIKSSATGLKSIQSDGVTSLGY